MSFSSPPFIRRQRACPWRRWSKSWAWQIEGPRGASLESTTRKGLWFLLADRSDSDIQSGHVGLQEFPDFVVSCKRVLVGEEAMLAAGNGDEFVLDSRLGQALVQAHRLRVRHDIIAVSVDGDDRRQSRANITERRDFFGDGRAVLLISQ